MTDGDAISPEQLARIEQIMQRRSAGRQRSAELPPPPPTSPAPTARGARPRRRHHALGSRIVAAGLGATTMFGILTALGRATPASSTDTQVPHGPAPAPQPIRIVIHRVPTTVADQPAVAPAIDQVEAVAPTAPGAPIELTAEPVVRTITVESAPAPRPAPVATTSGSS